MKKSAQFLLVIQLITGIGVSAQTISDIKYGKDQIAYIKSGDSLFISGLLTSSIPVFVDKGLGENGNQRLLNWSRNNKQLIYEKNANLHTYDLQSRTSKILNTSLRDSLSFFRFFKVRQASMSPQNQYYFSAAIKGQELLQLFKIDLTSGKLEQLSNSASYVGNISASHDGLNLVYSTYQYIGEKPQSVLYLTDQDGHVIFSKQFKDAFINNFSWSPDDQMMLVVGDNRLSKLYRHNKESHTLQELDLPFADNETPVEFYNSNSVVYTLSEGGNKKTGLLNLDTGFKTLLFTNDETLLSRQTAEIGSPLYYLKESRVEPRGIWRKETASSMGVLVKSLVTVNPLAKYNYFSHRYQNGGGKFSSAYVYLPVNYGKTGKSHPVLLVPYGNYANSYPPMDYFLNEYVFTYLSKGYIIIFPNTRGVGSEAQKDEYGKMQLEDTRLFINNIKQELNMDMNHLWVIGHSHGATMVYYYLTHSDLFRGGIAINGAADWIKQAALKSMSGLPFGMGGTPEDHPDKYHEYSPLENINKLNSPMLLIAGKNDTQIHYDINSVAFQKLAERDKKQTRLIVFENEGHLIQNPENRKIFQKEVDSFLNKYK